MEDIQNPRELTVELHMIQFPVCVQRTWNQYVYDTCAYACLQQPGKKQADVHAWVKQMWRVYTLDYYTFVTKKESYRFDDESSILRNTLGAGEWGTRQTIQHDLTCA